LVDLVNNLDRLAEDKQEVLRNVVKKAEAIDVGKLAHSVSLYGTAKTNKLLSPVVSKNNFRHSRKTNNVKYVH